MRPTTVRFSNTNRSAMRRRSGFAMAPVGKKTATAPTLVERKVLTTFPETKIGQAA
ncbi:MULTISPECIES: hypothetical protein [Vibrio]|uniref:Uncharacterized protein n=1 Tax=Vibrio chanodichtyis TaxID=3027932 RepID=A0ABT5V259_9VIBR|nr:MULTISPECIES: hypothetical protein [Vibrio]MDE1515752.1 hypothetical protein [Vibrio chanodichtyis]